MRKTIYISERRNKAIADFISGVQAKDVSYEAVKLMEDGMKWRESGNDVNAKVLAKRSDGEVLPPKAKAPIVEKAFEGIRLEKKKLDRSGLEAKFNSL